MARGPEKVLRILTHFGPHLDEITAIYLLQTKGEERYPGIATAPIDFCSTGGTPEGKTWREHWAEGTICVGVGGGPFDEHSGLDGEPRKDRESACSLVAKAFSLFDHPLYANLIKEVTRADQSGVHPLHLANLIKRASRLRRGDDSFFIFGMATAIITDWLQEQQLFLDAREQLLKLESEWRIISPGTPSAWLAVVSPADNFMLPAAARSLDIAMLVMRQPSGNVQIMPNPRFPICLKIMPRLVAELRLAECRLRGWSDEQIKAIPDQIWCGEGRTSRIPWWYFQVPGRNALNGSETATDVPATVIPLEEIAKLVGSVADLM